MKAETVGCYFVDDRNRVWQHVSYTDQPTATFRLVEDETQRLNGVVGSPLLSGLRLLRPVN